MKFDTTVQKTNLIWHANRSTLVRKSRSHKQTNASCCVLTFQAYYLDERTRQSAGLHISNFHLADEELGRSVRD